MEGGAASKGSPSSARTEEGKPAEKVSRRSGKFSRNGFILESPASDFPLAYEVKEEIGCGTYGTVNRAVNKSTGVVRAVKIVAKKKLSDMKRFKAEVATMKKLDHPGILKLYEVYEDVEKVYLVLELCEGGELFDCIVERKSFSEKDAAKIVHQIVSAVHYCHLRKIAHRDLKPENFLLLDGGGLSIKVIDFGLARDLSDVGEESSTCVMRTRAGTSFYVAPEVLRGPYSEKCDLWSVGVVMYFLLCGYLPFRGDTDREVLEAVRKEELEFDPEEWDCVSDSAKDLLRKLIERDVEKRLTASQAMEHPWIKTLAERSEAPLTNAILHNMRRFRAAPTLKKAALQIIATHVPDVEIEDLKQIFQALDENQDGSLSVQEMKEGLAKFDLGHHLPDLPKLLESIDSDGSGQMDYTEFIAAAMERRQYLKSDVLWSAFRVFDRDGDGKITQAELQQVLQSSQVNSTWGPEVVGQLLRGIDRNGDGEIDFEEFVKAMENTYTQYSQSMSMSQRCFDSLEKPSDAQGEGETQAEPTKDEAKGKVNDNAIPAAADVTTNYESKRQRVE